MGQIQRLSRGRVKPYNSVPRIDWSHPLAVGLVTYCYDIGGSIVDLVNGGQITQVGTGGSQQSQFGRGAQITPTGYGYMPALPANKINGMGGAAPYSAACGTFFTGFPTSTTGDCACVTVQDSANTLNTEFGFNTWPAAFSTGNPFPGRNSFLAITNNSDNDFFNTALLLNTYQSWAFSASSASAANLYSNGIFDNSIGTTTTFSTVTSPQVMYNTASINAGQTFGLCGTGFIYYFTMWRRAISAKEALLLHQDPYCFLIYPEDDFLIVGAAAGSNAAGSSSGTGVAAGIGASVVASLASSTGTGVATGVGRSAIPSVGSLSGTGTASAIGSSIVASIASSSGAGIATAVGISTSTSVGTSSGISSATGVTLSIATSIGSSSGSGSALGVGTSSGGGSAGTVTGVATASGVGISTAVSVATSSGAGIATGVSLSTVASVGTSTGLSTASGVSPTIVTISAVGTAFGVATVTAFTDNISFLGGSWRKRETPPSNAVKEAAAVLSKMGGHARAASLSSTQRSNIASMAAKARWR